MKEHEVKQPKNVDIERNPSFTLMKLVVALPYSENDYSI